MTDLVERLRGRPAPGDHCSKLIAEAADEIELQQGRLELANATLELSNGIVDHQRTEIERLQAEFELFREAPSKLEVAQYEIERLRAERDEWLHLAQKLQRQIEGGERDRLRGAM